MARTVVLAAVALVALALPAHADHSPATERCPFPARVLDLTGWKMTLPTGGEEDPTEITQPELDTFSARPWFQATNNCEAVRFRSPVNGVTTGGSAYPRAELREMTADGSDEAAWDATEGTHTLVVTEAFMALPNDKPHLVGAQIHDGDDDVTVFRLEGNNLYITSPDVTHHHLVTDNYVLGTEFEAKFVVENGEIDVYHNGELQTTIPHTRDGNYFKAGAYTQANCTNSAPCHHRNYGEVHISDLQVTHS
ncbi:polysaccharide lyase family 7 protein [Actinophytocola xinjiangensis]|uniref:Polysaccharide lyase family 7 protein n=1 Tax=Actinophytocola xinjiangensis TaxID=485602 RepID=A0A7Z0WGV8_9PSEU|nr:polysaccharide lyase family 7 protein [Actinophytocola xinjiangensis]OLF06953.1 polysaccharide lyase family 7 protein [Actinophytocola xinjiangensis]